jgi:nicotinic acetylcholine receptor, invertebrate
MCHAFNLVVCRLLVNNLNLVYNFQRLPILSGEKVGLGLTCFVAYSLFMIMVAEKVPATGETVPIISTIFMLRNQSEMLKLIKFNLN